MSITKQMNLEAILHFIHNFDGATDVFLHGCCYWFAYILNAEFGLTVVYEPVEGHFMAKGIFGDGLHLFDVRGDVSEKYKGAILHSMAWYEKNEPNWYKHIMRDCRHFLRPSDEELEVA